MMYNETVNVARSMGMPTNDGTDAENRMVIESRYKVGPATVTRLFAGRHP